MTSGAVAATSLVIMPKLHITIDRAYQPVFGEASCARINVSKASR